MVATISADLVRSSSLLTDALIALRSRLLDLFRGFEADYPGFWARIVRGDGIECFVPEYRCSLRIALLIKLCVKMQVSRFECSDLLKRYGIRFAIGLADIDCADKEADVLNGPAIWLSGRGLEAISRKGAVYSALELEHAFESVNDLLDSYVGMLSNLVDAYSVKQAEVVFFKLLGLKEVEIAERLGIFQSAVNARSTGAQWSLLGRAVKDFEAFDFEGICG